MAQVHEPPITEWLPSTAEEMGGELINLEFRLKTPDAIARKLDKYV